MRLATTTQLVRRHSTEVSKMTHTFNGSPRSGVFFQDAPTRSIDVGGTAFAYRELGPRTACR